MKYLSAEQVHTNPGTHYNPPQRAVLTDDRIIHVVRQDGDGEKTWYYTYDNEKISPDQIKEWK